MAENEAHEADDPNDKQGEYHAGQYVPHEGSLRAGKPRAVRVERDPLEATNAEGRESVVVLQTAELALHGGTSMVEAAEPPAAARSAVHPRGGEGAASRRPQ